MKRSELWAMLGCVLVLVTLIVGLIAISEKGYHWARSQTTGPEIELVDAGDGWYTIRIRCPGDLGPPPPPDPPPPDPIPPPEPPPPIALEDGLWLDTGPNNSMLEDDSLFSAIQIDDVTAMGTTSSGSNIHSHYLGDVWAAPLTFTGEMLQDSTMSGVGVTVVSQYPQADHYYRLRRYGANPFHLAPHGTSVLGDSQTTLVAEAGVWYAFKVEVTDTGSRTEIRANIWMASEEEPAGWDIDCFDDTPTRLLTGRIGIWSHATMGKFWRRLAVDGVAAPPPPPPVVGSALLRWDAPTEYVDGSALIVDHYRVYHSTIAGSCNSGSVRQIESPSLTWSDLGAGSHFFTVSAVDALGVESICTNEVSAVVQ